MINIIFSKLSKIGDEAVPFGFVTADFEWSNLERLFPV